MCEGINVNYCKWANSFLEYYNYSEEAIEYVLERSLLYWLLFPEE